MSGRVHLLPTANESRPPWSGRLDFLAGAAVAVSVVTLAAGPPLGVAVPVGLALAAVLGWWFLGRRAIPPAPDALHAQRLAAVGVLAGAVAHDINNLLTAAVGHAELAAAAAGPDSAAGPHAARAAAAAGRCAGLARQLMTYAARTPPSAGPVLLDHLVRDTVGLVAAAVPKPVRLTVAPAAADLPPVTGDESQLRQVVLNLVLNAGEAVGDRPGAVTVGVTVGPPPADRSGVVTLGGPDPFAGRPRPFVRLSVADTGAGMDAATRAKMFDPFFTTKPAGHGLGLAAVLGIVRAHGGAVQVASTPGVGTEFVVWLPAAAGTARPDARTVAPSGTPAAPPARPVALVVDDEDIVRRLAEEMLVQSGWEVVTAAGGREAVELFRHAHPRVGLVLLDLGLPDATGGEVLTRLRAIRPDVPVLLCTGQSDDSAAAGAAGAADGMLAKPFRRADLAAAVAAAVAARPAAGLPSAPAGT